MRVIDKNGRKKNIPKKYEPVIEGFEFTSSKYRLQPDERFALLNLLIIYHFKTMDAISVQAKFAKAHIALHFGDIDILKVNKREYVQWRIKANALELNIDSELVSDCPKIYLTEKNEF